MTGITAMIRCTKCGGTGKIRGGRFLGVDDIVVDCDACGGCGRICGRIPQFFFVLMRRTEHHYNERDEHRVYLSHETVVTCIRALRAEMGRTPQDAFLIERLVNILEGRP